MKIYLLFSNFIRKVLINPSVVCITLLTKQSNLVIIAGRMSRVYADNPKYLFEYLQKQDEFVNCVFFIRNKSKYKQLKKNNKNIVYSYSFKALYYFAKSKVVVIGHGLEDFYPFYLSNKKKYIINLFHAIPLKKIGITVKYNDVATINKMTHIISSFIVSSDEEKDAIAIDLGLDKEKIMALGQPRNDSLINIEENAHSKKFKKENFGYKTILYAPTFRDNGRKVEFFPFEDVNYKELNSFLESINSKIIIRSHVNDFERLKKESIGNYDRIVFSGQDDYPDIQEILPLFDVVITDYSSVCLDFLLVNKPMVFLPYDLELYKKERGFLFEYNEATAGKKVFTQKDFLLALKDGIENPNKEKPEREIQKQRFHKYLDGGSSKRITSLIKKQLG